MSKGIFNTYNKKKSFFEVFFKDLNHIHLFIRQFLKNGFRTKTIFIYPDYPGSGTTIYKVAKTLNYNLTNKVCNNPDIIIFWEDQTHKTQFLSLEPFLKSHNVINYNSRDISKVFVDNQFKSVFFYSVIINPKTFSGKIVAKSDINAAHDGQIIKGPLSDLKDNMVYQRLINNQFDANSIVDFRVPIVNKTLDFVYLKYRDINERFKNTTIKTELKPIIDVLSSDEIILINKFVKKIELDYGELDILRDKDDGKIYIVDVNNTPHGPPANTNKNDAATAIEKISHALLNIT